MTTTKLSLKLLIDRKAHKVLFAEAGKDIIDFLFSLLALPLGTVVRLLTKQNMVGCITNLYDSVRNLNETYIESKRSKESLLEPKAATCVAQIPLLLSKENTAPAEGAVKYYKCGCGCKNYVTNIGGIICPGCGTQMLTQIYFVGSQAAKVESTGDGGFVKGLVTYMVMDDLAVSPMSTTSSITLLNKFNVKEVGSLEEKVVDLGMEEGLALLKAALQSKTVLTNVFLGKKTH